MLREFMIENGMSQSEIAKRLNVSQAFISAILSGRKKMPPRLIDYLNKLQIINSKTEYTVLTDSVLNKIIMLLIKYEHRIDETMYEDLRTYIKSL